MALLKNVLGLDLGSHGLKAVEIHQTLRGFEVVALRSLPHTDEQAPLAELVQNFVALALQLEPAGSVGDSLAAVVAAVDPRVLSAPDLVDRLVGVDLEAVEEH